MEIIEVLRGLAAFMVAGFHVASAGFLPKENLVAQSFSYGWVGVNIFFIISGFILPYSMYVSNYSIRNYFLFLKKRIIRIEPPYVISFLIIILLIAFTRYYSPGSASFFSMIGHVAYLNAFTGEPWLNIVYWTLAIEFQFYLAIGLLFPLLINKKNAIQITLFVVFLLINLIPVSKNLSILSSYFNFFMFGILLFQYYIKVIDKIYFLIFLFMLLAFTTWHNNLGLTILVMATLSLITLFKQRSIKSKPLLFLGSISYSLYLIHAPLGSILNSLFKRIISNIDLLTASVFAMLGIIILGAYIYYLVAEKPFKKISSSIKYVENILKPV